jgi:hypothetical protein
MIYILKVYSLIVFLVFGLAGTVVLALAAWNEAKQYALARDAMRRMARGLSREPLVISRRASRNHTSDLTTAA